MLDTHEDHRRAEDWCWSPWNRAELFNSLRQLARCGAITPSESAGVIRLFEADVRAESFRHTEPDWRDVLRKFGELSAAHDDLPIRAADLLHVAYAIETQSDTFVTIDDDQRALAKAAGWQVPLI